MIKEINSKKNSLVRVPFKLRGSQDLQDLFLLYRERAVHQLPLSIIEINLLGIPTRYHKEGLKDHLNKM